LLVALQRHLLLLLLRPALYRHRLLRLLFWHMLLCCHLHLNRTTHLLLQLLRCMCAEGPHIKRFLH
jgi:hypothetical protein